jgi:1-acyl-sn-glycerol-3-phosphate acyltransferase
MIFDPLQKIVSVFAWIGIAFCTLFFTLMMAVYYPLALLIDPDRRGLHRIASFWGRSLILLAPGCRVEVIGAENLPKDKPVIFACNHQSYVDIPTLFFLPGQFKWMADAGLFQIPVFGQAISMAGYLPVKRGDPKAAVAILERARRVLARGISIFIFPEGTRSTTGLLGRFQSGGFRVALATQTPVVPVLLIGTRQLLPRGSWYFRWGIRLQVRILPPIQPPASAHGMRGFVHAVRAKMRSDYLRSLKQYR